MVEHDGMEEKARNEVGERSGGCFCAVILGMDPVGYDRLNDIGRMVRVG